jgi:hypothetical protein
LGILLWLALSPFAGLGQQVLTFAEAERLGKGSLLLERAYTDMGDSLPTLSKALGDTLKRRLLADGYYFPRRVQVFGRLFVGDNGQIAYLLFTPMCNIDGWLMPASAEQKLGRAILQSIRTNPLPLPKMAEPYSFPFTVSEGRHLLQRAAKPKAAAVPH